jgi:hypothetical protein
MLLPLLPLLPVLLPVLLRLPLLPLLLLLLFRFEQIPLAEALQPIFGCADPTSGVPVVWRVLPFGLSHAPRIFQAITSSFVRVWRACGVVCLAYLDDILVFASSLAKALVRPYVQLEMLGVVVHAGAVPAFSMSHARVARMRAEATALLRTRTVRLRDLQGFLGRCSWAAIVAPTSILFCVSLIAHSCLSASFGALPPFDAECRDELHWWLRDGCVPC